MKRVSFRVPFELEIMDAAAADWLPQLKAALDDGGYSPGTVTTVELPKSRGLVRPIAMMSLRDRVVYNAAVHACFPLIFSSLAWAQATKDFAYVLSPVEKTPPWFKNAFKNWDRFRKASLANLEARSGAVAITDVAAFYENVPVSRLISDLQALRCPPAAVAVLMQCLNRWCQVEGRGIPQDSFASHILAKVYLDPLDRALKNDGWLHARYADDLRIFCDSEQAAETALLLVARLLRRRGLSLQGAKTQVLSGEEARKTFEGRTPTIQRISREWRQSVVDAIGSGEGSPYLGLADIDKLIQDEPDRIPTAVIRNAFDDFISREVTEGFDKSVFHFLLNRLAKAGDAHALPSLAPKLMTHPQETAFVLRYVRQVGGESAFEPTLIAYLRSEQGQVYDAQRLMVMSWWSDGPADPSPAAVAFARDVAFSSSTSPMPRAAARAVLAARADLSDLERLQDAYDNTGNELERAQILCCLRGPERTRLRAFSGRTTGDGELPRFAAAWLKRQDGQTAD